MIGLLLKDLRLLMAAPVLLVSVLVWSCIVLWFTKLLPPPTLQIDLALLQGKPCLEHTSEEACPYPETDVLVHAISDISEIRFHGFVASETDIYRQMDEQELDVVLVWYSTSAAQDFMDSVVDLSDYDEVESGGVWVAYVRAGSQATMTQVRFLVRQIQTTGLSIANARRQGRSPGLPSIGTVETFSEFGAFAIAKQADTDNDRQRDQQQMIREAVLDAVEGQLLELASVSEAEFSEQDLESLRRIFRSQLSVQSYDEQRIFAAALEDAVNNDARTPELQISRADAAFLTRALSAGDQVQRSFEEELPKATPFLLSEQAGPARDDSTWLVPGLIAIIAVALAFTFTALSTIREREQGTEHFLFTKHLAAWENPMIVKPIAPSLLSIASVMLMLLFCQSTLGYSVKFGVGSAIGLMMLGVLTGATHGLIAGSLVRNQSDAAAASGAYLISLLLFGDVLIPIGGVVQPASLLASVLPVVHVNEAWANWMKWGTPVSISDYVPLLKMLLFSLALAVFALMHRRRRI